MRLVALVAAHNEQDAIGATLRSLLAQRRPLDAIVVAVDNCTDRTLTVVKSFPGVIAFETEGNTDKKSGALNQAWDRYGRDADLLMCLDADTVLDDTAAEDWEREFAENLRLGGCSAKFTMLVRPEMSFTQRLLVRLQRAEFSRWTDVALRRDRRTSVLAGTACCLRNSAIHRVVRARLGQDPSAGPWLTKSMVEDFELTYRLRDLGWQTKVSATVRAYTDAMTDLRSLWAQRMKWQTGTVQDLIGFGFNRLTRFDWLQQFLGLASIVVRLMWILLLLAAIATGNFVFHPAWLVPPVIFVANDVKQALRIPHVQPADVVVAALMVPQELFAFMRAAWFTASWSKVLDERVFGIRQPDRWDRQAQAERNRTLRSAVYP